MQLFSPKYEVEECLDALRPVLESGWTGCGPVCRSFEEAWGHYAGSKHSLFLNSATSALHIALRLCDLPKGAPVLTTALTFASTNAVILYENLTPVFVDINEKDFSLDAEDFLRKQEMTKAKAALWVHYAGNVSSEFYKIYKAIQNTPFHLIEDCAHAAGGSYQNGKKIGSLPDTSSCFSFHSVKNLPTFDAGMLCMSNAAEIERARKLSWLGIDKDTFARTNSTETDVYKWRYDIPELGWKYNGNDIAAAIAKVQLKHLDRDNLYRKQLYTWYKENLTSLPSVQLIEQTAGSSHHLVVLRVKNRDELIAALKAKGIAPGVHYLPNNEFPVFQKFYKKGDCPVLEKVSKELISLPNHLRMKKQDVDYICEVVRATAKP